ncbi:MAG TPA: phosphodiester glycosidase family protein [Gemmatimonas sp.]|nr:phosphodiester glycosidase family protein [Gemmatimonas sp.]
MTMRRRALYLAAAFTLQLPFATMAQGTGARTPIGHVRCAPAAAAAAATSAASAPISPALSWRGDAALRWTEWPVALGARAVQVRVIVVDLDPARVGLDLEIARDGDAMRPWSLDDAPLNAAVAFNAGQFTDDGPWGWVVHRGRAWQAPRTGPLAGTVVVDSVGAVTITATTATQNSNPRRVAVREALQSFPMLLLQGRPAPLLCNPNAKLDRTHRDIRFAIGVRADGHVLLALTRYEGVGQLSARLPVGPTTHETAELMRRLGAREALMLDGGLSAQLLVRDGSATHRWEGMRRVPLAIVGKRLP